MKRKIALIIACCMVLGLVGCSSESSAENSTGSGLQVEAVPTETPQEPQAAETADAADLITEQQAAEAIRNYCISENPELAEMVESEDNMAYWNASTTDAGEICVLYRSYTGALIRYYVNPETGDTYVTEQVPGIIDEEQKTDETLNLRDLMK